MYLTPYDLRCSREASLHNFLTLSQAGFEAGSRLNELWFNTGRQALRHSQPVWSGQAAPIDSQARQGWALLQNTAPYVVEALCHIVGEAHTALLQAADAQVKIFDSTVQAALARTARSSPWEGELALHVLKTTLESAENTLHRMTETAIDTVEMAESQVHHLAAQIVDQPVDQAADQAIDQPADALAAAPVKPRGRARPATGR